MAFQFKKTDTFAATVNVEMPTDDPKRPNKGSFVARFKHVDRAQLETLLERAAKRDLPDEEFMRDYVVGISGIGDAGGEFDPEEQRRIVYSEPLLIAELAATFFKSVQGARAKN